MFQWLKNLLKWILPPPVRAFNREVERILAAVEGARKTGEEQNRRLEAQNAALQRQLEGQSAAIQKQMEKLSTTFQTQIEELSTTFQTQMAEQRTAFLKQSAEQEVALQKQLTAQSATTQEQLGVQIKQLDIQQYTLAQVQQTITSLTTDVQNAQSQAEQAARHSEESVWAEIFNNTIIQSTWLKDKTFSPGRWAVGYPYLYVMYRVLNEVHPKRVLELGLGQSTRMISQYAVAFDDVEHIVVEHDPAWIDFFSRDFPLPEQTELVQLDLDMIPFRGTESVRIYKDFQARFAGQQFNFISIDAPLGGDLKQYSRIDVLNMLPQCLGEEWVIMIDDCNRQTELHTVGAMEKCLRDNGIVYRHGVYQGDKRFILIVPEHLGFLTSM